MTASATPRARAGDLVLSALAAAAIAVCAPSFGAAQQRGPEIDRAIARALDMPLPSRPRSGAPAGRARPGAPVPVLIELDAPRSLGALTALAQHGVMLRAPEGRPIAWQRFVPARIDHRGLRALSTASFVRSVRLAPPRGIPALDRSRERIELAAARGASRGPEPYTGAGTVIADIDTAIDVFHPAFFRADGGHFDWIDVDGDGVFAPGLDAIDLDVDGELDAAEIADVVPAMPISFAAIATDPLRRSAFDPSIDWVFLDTDGDARRDFGPADGYGDSNIAFGEPIFVPDDVDGDGQIDPEERFLRLASSKIRSYFVSTPNTVPPFEHVYRRGVDLASALRDYTQGSYGYADTLHATGVAGILIGDVPLVSRRWVGIAPDAELVVAFSYSDDAATEIAWALAEGPDIMLHEQVQWTRTALDGSDPVSTLIDESTALDRIAHVCPAGNIGGQRKHAIVELAGHGVADLPFTLEHPLTVLDITVHTPAGATATVQLTEPSGASHVLVADHYETLASGAGLWHSEATTARGYRVQTLVIADTIGGTLPTGGWTVRIASATASTARVDAFLSDDNGFAAGAAWSAAYADDRSTIGWPATADACLGVGAIAAHTADEGAWYAASGHERWDEVRSYSARGPRIDGYPSLGIVAPDNPWSPLGAGDVFPSAPGTIVAPEAAFQMFGGTSGAGPHVAGVLALLAEAGIRGAPALDAIRSGARRSDVGTGPLPDDDYGHGRLSAAGALGVPSGEGSPPVVILRAEPLQAPAGTTVTLVTDVLDDGAGPIEIQWDDGYDGVWDSDYGPVADREIVLDPALLRFKVRARDADGRVGEAAVLLRIGERIEAPEPDAGAGVEPIDPPRVDGGCGCRAGDADGGDRGSRAWGSIAGLAMIAALIDRRAARRRRRAIFR
jgi:hypothetical protein